MNIGTWCFNIAAFYPAKQRYSFFSICQKDQKGIFVSRGTAFPSEELVLQRFILILILQEKKTFQYILISLVLILFMSVSWFRFYLFAGKSNQDHVKTHGSHPGYASGSGS